jgi:hypothetical protein
MQLVEQLKILRMGPSRKEIDIMEEYRAERKRKLEL